MRVFKRTSSLTLVAVAAATMWFWLGGCDFSPVDEGARVSAKNHAAALNSATDPSDAERAIRQLFAKIGATSEIRPGVETTEYFGVSLSDAAIKDLAKAQASFNAGNESRGASIAAIYEAIHERVNVEVRGVPNVELQAIPVELVDALVALRASAQRALTNPEKAENAALIALVADRSGVPSEVPLFSASKVLSPVQVILFGFWLHNSAQSIPAFSMDEEVSSKIGGGGKGGDKYKDRDKDVQGSCPAGQVLLAKFEWEGGRYVYEKGLGSDVIAILKGTTDKVEWASGVRVETIIVKAAWYSDYHTYTGGVVDGTFYKSDKHDISNIQFCGGKDDPNDPKIDCYWKCKKKMLIGLLLCLTSPDPNSCRAYVLDEAHKCGQSCHDQGNASPDWWSL